MNLFIRKTVERVQRRVNKSIPNLKQLDYLEYMDRLRKLNLPSLQHRRRRGDMIYAYKIMTEKVKIKANDIFKRTSRTLRGHDFKIQKKKATKVPTINVFINRIVNDWNSLPRKIMSATTINSFKNALDKYWKEEMFQTLF